MDSGKEEIRKEMSVYLDRIEEIEDGTAEAVLLIDEGEEDYSGEFHLPEKFLPKEVSEGDYLKIEIWRNEDKIDTDENSVKQIIVNLKQIEKSAHDTAEAILSIDAEEHVEFYLPENFLPENAAEGDYLTIKICRDEDKTNAALDEARQLLKELE